MLGKGTDKLISRAIAARVAAIALIVSAGSAIVSHTSFADDAALWQRGLGIVRDADTARTLALTLWRGMYGEEAAGEQEPAIVDDLGDRWRVSGSPSGPIDVLSLPVKAPMLIEIAKADGRVLVFSFVPDHPAYPRAPAFKEPLSPHPLPR